MQPSTFKTITDKILVLDELTLFLMRARVMEDSPRLQSNRRFHTVDELRAHLESLNESYKYFKDAKIAIGPDESATRTHRRTPLKVNNVWNAVVTMLTRRLTAGEYDRLKGLDSLRDIFGFESVEAMKTAALSSGYHFNNESVLLPEAQDKIARVFERTDWMDFIGADSTNYLVSESLLQRAYGKYRCKSALRENALNYITQYICDMNWKEYNTPAGRKQAYESIVGRLVKPEMKKIISQLNAPTKQKQEAILGVKEGDHITLTHEDGTTDTFIYKNGAFHHSEKNEGMCA